MPETKTLHDLFVDELKDSYDHEKQLVKALRKMTKAAQHPDLAKAFSTHLDETVGQVATLEKVFALLELKPKGKHCAGIAGIIEEGGDAIEDIAKSPVRDAALVGGGKRAEHYEIAAYTAMIGMAKQLGMPEAAAHLQDILNEELACDAKLDELAKKLLPLTDTGDDDDMMSERSTGKTAKKSSGKKAAAKKATTRKR